MVRAVLEFKKRDFLWVVPLVLVLVIGFSLAVVDPNIHGHPDAGSVPVGTVAAFNLESCPSGWALADGSAGLPDLRGTFIRGDGGEANGRDVARVLGDYQEDEFGSHTHDATLYKDVHVGVNTIGGGHSSYIGETSAYSIGATGGVETRPKNVALLYCVSLGGGSVDVGNGFAPVVYDGGETVVYPNGMIMKTGTGSGSQATHTVTFGSAFPNGISSVVLTPLINSDTPHSYPMHVKSKSVSDFVYRQPNGGGGYTSVDWVAWGY